MNYDRLYITDYIINMQFLNLSHRKKKDKINIYLKYNLITIMQSHKYFNMKYLPKQIVHFHISSISNS